MNLRSCQSFMESSSLPAELWPAGTSFDTSCAASKLLAILKLLRGKVNPKLSYFSLIIFKMLKRILWKVSFKKFNNSLKNKFGKHLTYI